MGWRETLQNHPLSAGVWFVVTDGSTWWTRVLEGCIYKPGGEEQRRPSFWFCEAKAALRPRDAVTHGSIRDTFPWTNEAHEWPRPSGAASPG
ncbi:unnamed protein product [Arctogadus glacialis]